MLGVIFWWLLSSALSLALTVVVLVVAFSAAKSYWRHGEVKQSMVLEDFRQVRDKVWEATK